jgi:hypothetical protein
MSTMATAANTTARARARTVKTDAPASADTASTSSTGNEARAWGQGITLQLPSPQRLIYYAGLGTLAAVGVIEWPVAAAIGVGVWLSGRQQKPPSTPPHTPSDRSTDTEESAKR